MAAIHPAFEESALQFCFSPANGVPASLRVKRFDQQSFYQAISGMGFKGVDFIVLQGDALFLIEVKNYRYPGFEVDSSQLDKAALAEKLIEKALDSTHLLRIIYLYFQRKWYIRFFNSLFRKLPTLHPGYSFWLNAYEAHQAGRCTVVYWLEGMEKDPVFQTPIRKALEPEMLHVLFADTTQNSLSKWLKVVSL